MATDPGHAPNRVYIDAEGNFHLNGAQFFDDAENDIGDDLEGLNGLLAELGALDGFTGNTADLNLLAGADAAGFARADLEQNALSSGYRVPLTQFRVFDAMQTLLPGTAATDDMGLIGGTHATAPPLLEGVAVAAGSSETQNARVTVSLPAEYDGAETITLRCRARVTEAMNTAQTLDAIVVSNDDDGTVSADLNTTAAVTLTTSFADHDFTITPTGLAAGDELDVLITSVADDTGGSGTGRFQLARFELLLDIKG